MGEYPSLCVRNMHAVRTQCKNFAFQLVIREKLHFSRSPVGLSLVPAFILYLHLGIVRMGVKRWLHVSCYTLSRLR